MQIAANPYAIGAGIGVTPAGMGILPLILLGGTVLGYVGSRIWLSGKKQAEQQAETEAFVNVARQDPELARRLIGAGATVPGQEPVSVGFPWVLLAVGGGLVALSLLRRK